MKFERVYLKSYVGQQVYMMLYPEDSGGKIQPGVRIYEHEMEEDNFIVELWERYFSVKRYETVRDDYEELISL